VSKEDLDSSSLISAAEASKKFKRAEKRSGEFTTFSLNIFIVKVDGTERHRARTRYAYPPSPTSSEPPESPTRGPPPLSYRLQALQAELSTLEADISDPTNPILVNEQGSGIDPGELLRGLVDVRGRLEKINGTKTGRGKFVNAVIDGGRVGLSDANQAELAPVGKRPERQDNPQDLVKLDERVGELESVIGSSTASLDEVGTQNLPDIMWNSYLSCPLSYHRCHPPYCRCSRG
jgi:nuclear migration protein JNM1